LEGKFSIYYTCAVAFLDNDASEYQYQDEKVNNQEIIAFQKKIKPKTDENMAKDKVFAVLQTYSGKKHEVLIEHATGSLENPMTQKQINQKFKNLCNYLLDKNQMNNVIEKMMHFEELDSIEEILKQI